MGLITNYDDICIICGRKAEHQHHCISGVAGRRFAESASLVVPMCSGCHNMFSEDNVPKTKTGKAFGQSCDVHHCRKLEVLMKIIGQLAWEKQWVIDNYGITFDAVDEEAREAFRKKAGQSFL